MNFQRLGSVSNSQVGRDFEAITKSFFAEQNLVLSNFHKIPIGVGDQKKFHTFDLGSLDPKVIVECKSHTWTTGNNVPSAKMTVWNEAMYFFAIAPNDYRKIFFVLRHSSESRKETLAKYYLRTYEHLIPLGVEIWEYDIDLKNGYQIK